jgi:pteridine reductase
MEDNVTTLDGKTLLITGAARRVGAVIAEHLHAAGMNLCIHYRSSFAAAQALKERLEGRRPDSVFLVQADLMEFPALENLVEQAYNRWGRLDALINNASTFYPTPVGRITEAHWNDLLGSNLKAPLFLSQAAAPYLKAVEGNIVNIVDIHAERPLKGHPVYSIAKAGLAMLTKSMARELGPEVRVNGIAPGAILWPETEDSEATRAMILDRTALKRRGSPEDIARTALFLIRDAHYVTGQIIAVDGGRSLSQ